MQLLHELAFNNHFQTLGSAFCTAVQPQGLRNPVLEQANPQAAHLLGLDPQAFSSNLFLQVFSGNTVLPGCQPVAQNYAGHQFGRFNPMLGDGRVALLGAVETDTGSWEISLKGAGKTPYARTADGLAGSRECLHEYTLSKTLHELGIPTAHCLCVISGEQLAYRHGFERAAILTRLAPTHIRFGTFEKLYFQRNHTALQQLAEHVITHYYSDCRQEQDATCRYACLFRRIVLRTARLIAHWQAAGFTHGMMNTDNQSIIGITLDLGAAAFTPEHDPAFVGSPLDEHGRYAFGRQPQVGLWNCNVLAKALSPLIPARLLRDALLGYEPEYLRCHEQLKQSMASGLG